MIKNMWWQKKNKVLFYCSISGVEETMPILPAKDVSYAWVKKVMKSFKEKSLDVSSTSKDGKIRHVSRCPGIFGIKNQGWIIRTWQDIELTLDESAWSWRTPMNQKTLSNGLSAEEVTHHPEESLKQHLDHWPENAFQHIIKINTPWFVKVPKGYVLNQFHPAYLDENRFTSLPGSYSPDHGAGTINIPMIWHSKKGNYLIKAGTPIAQLILSKKEDIDYEIKLVDDKFKKEQSIKKILETMTFKRIYKNIIKYHSAS